MRSIIKKKKNILFGTLFIAIIVCTPFLFGEEGCDDGFNEVANSVNENIQNEASGGSGNNNFYGIDLTADDARGLLQLLQTHRITEEKAKELALQSAQSLYANSNARTNRSIANVSTIYYNNGEKTNARVAETEPSAFPIYIVNFANDLGFSIVGGDERLGDPVLFEAEKGTYNAEYFNDDKTNGKTSEQQVRHLFRKLIPAYVERKIEEENKIREPLLRAAVEKINARVPDSLKITLSNNPNGRENTQPIVYWQNAFIAYWYTVTYDEITASRSPLVNLQWGGPCAPYNNNLDPSGPCRGSNCDNNKLGAGSMAICEGMLAAYWRKPTTYNWSEMLSSPAYALSPAGQSEVARLIQDIYNVEGANTTCYAVDDTHLDLTFFANNNFTVPLPVSYSDALVRASLDNNRPVPITASVVLGNTINVGHFNFRSYVWLLDAYITRSTVVRFYVGPRSCLNPNPPSNCSSKGTGVYIFNPITKVRSNFGLGGIYEGYSTSGIFDTSLTSTTGNNNPVDGYPNLRIVPELHPN